MPTQAGLAGDLCTNKRRLKLRDSKCAADCPGRIALRLAKHRGLCDVNRGCQDVRAPSLRSPLTRASPAFVRSDR